MNSPSDDLTTISKLNPVAPNEPLDRNVVIRSEKRLRLIVSSRLRALKQRLAFKCAHTTVRQKPIAVPPQEGDNVMQGGDGQLYEHPKINPWVRYGSLTIIPAAAAIAFRLKLGWVERGISGEPGVLSRALFIASIPAVIGAILAVIGHETTSKNRDVITSYFAKVLACTSALLVLMLNLFLSGIADNLML